MRTGTRVLIYLGTSTLSRIIGLQPNTVPSTHDNMKLPDKLQKLIGSLRSRSTPYIFVTYKMPRYLTGFFS